jgi:sulfatase maturation enzyme AslB (radical SAM superfamily)
MSAGPHLCTDLRATLHNWLGVRTSGMCVFNETCGTGLVIAYNGDLYACEHFVEPGLMQNLTSTASSLCD